MNSTIERVGWVGEPAGRGTFGLIVSCTVTIFLCTYSAIHPNVPRPGETGWAIWKSKIVYVVLCMFFPEFFVICAIGAYMDAQNLQISVSITRNEQSKNSTEDRTN